MSITAIKTELKKYASPERKKSNEWFFKTGKGQYGYGDKFIGISMPNARKVAKQFKDLNLPNVKKLLASPIHEERMTALLILVLQFKKGDEKKQKEVFDFYLKNDKHINNWDLVDVSAHKIVGSYILNHPKEKVILTKYAKSKNLWQRRIAMVSTFALIRENKFSQTMKIAKILLPDDHDLTHKVVGWMLREVWKRDHRLVEAYLIQNYDNLPRTTLRYAIERMVEFKRKRFLRGDFK